MNLTDTAVAALAVIGMTLMLALAVIPTLLERQAERADARVVPLSPGRAARHTSTPGPRQRAA